MKKTNNIISYIVIIFGAALAAFSLDTLLLPNTILDGGINGISIIISKLTSISLSILVLILNIPILLFGYKKIGKEFLIKSIYAMVIFAILLKIFDIINPITDEMLLATVFGGALLGIGVGIVMKFGGCLDGTETISIILSKKTNLSVGQIILLFNLVIYSIAGYVFGVDRALYSILTYFISYKLIDIIIIGFDQTKEALIITDRGEDLAKEIFEKLGRTTTTIKGEGLISGKKNIIYCVLTRMEIYDLKKVVRDMDETAFITISDVSEIIGKHIKSNKDIIEDRDE